MKNQKKMIKGRGWDILIVLDACRYDYFEDVYDDYLRGDYTRVESEGTMTSEWACKTFDEYMNDTVYFSSNPFINSYMDISDVGVSPCDNWKATDYFEEVIDVWDWGWDEEAGGVPPKSLTDAFLSVWKGERSILHYMQPHLPYFHKEAPNRGDEWTNRFIARGDTERNRNEVAVSMRSVVGEIIESIFGMKGVWFLRNIAGFNDFNYFELIYRQGNLDLIPRFYEHNLRLVFDYISKICNEIKKNIVITADHGEALGEKGIWGHKMDQDMDCLRIVPWLEVDEVNDEIINRN